MHIHEKYDGISEQLMTLDGIGNQTDMHLFRKNFFNADNAADGSVDANANVGGKTCINYRYEAPKAFSKYDGYYILWEQIRKELGLEAANEAITANIVGSIYINDSTGIYLPYCFNYSTYDIALEGLKGLVERPKCIAPKSLKTFFNEVEQFAAYAANSTLGATGFADILIVASCYVDKMLREGYTDHKLRLADEKAVWEYTKEILINLIYTWNWAFRNGQSPFTNVSVYDKYFLENLCKDYVLFGHSAKIETVQKVQELFLDAMNKELKRTALTFPVTTACFSKNEDGSIRDKEFLEMVSKKNLEFGFINIYVGETSTLSSCCRLRSEQNSEYFNSFGSGSTKIGSLGVVTINLPRIAWYSMNCSKFSKEQFFELLKSQFTLTTIINNAKREIIKNYIKIGSQPLYTNGFMDINKQYSTAGINGLYECLQILGYDILTEEGQAFAEEILINLGKWCKEAEQYYHAPHNLEQVPAESSAVKLAAKDHILGINTEYELYSNQFIPLVAETDLLNRIKLQGKFDKLFSGGAICHLNVNEPITDWKDIAELIEYSAKSGVIYFAINYKLNQCEEGHMWVGEETCPKCGKPVDRYYTRVVGFLTCTKNWNKTRREVDFPNRQFYKDVNIK